MYERLDRNCSYTVHTSPVLRSEHPEVIHIINEEVTMSFRKIFHSGVTVVQYLLDALLIRVPLYCKLTDFFSVHLPDTDRLQHNRISEESSIRGTSSEFLQKIPLKPCSEGICFSKKTYLQKFVVPVICHIIQIEAVAVLQEKIAIVYSLIVPLPIRRKRIVGRTGHSCCKTPDGIRSGCHHRIIGGTVKVRTFIIIVVGGHVFVTLAYQSLHG